VQIHARVYSSGFGGQFDNPESRAISIGGSPCGRCQKLWHDLAHFARDASKLCRQNGFSSSDLVQPSFISVVIPLAEPDGLLTVHLFLTLFQEVARAFDLFVALDRRELSARYAHLCHNLREGGQGVLRSGCHGR